MTPFIDESITAPTVQDGHVPAQ